MNSSWMSLLAVVVGLVAPLRSQVAPATGLDLPDEELAGYRARLDEDPFQVVRTGLKDAATAKAALEPLDPDQRVRLIRAALWSKQPEIAGGAVALCDKRWLDLAELRQAAEVGRTFAFTRHADVYFGELRDWIDREQVATVLGDAPPLPRKGYYAIGMLHRSLRPEHAALLSRLTVCDDFAFRSEALEYLHTIAAHSDRNRPLVGATLLSWPGEVELRGLDPFAVETPAQPRPYELREKTGGYPRVLAASLDRLFLRPDPGKLQRYVRWTRAWVFDSRPAASDLELLLRLTADGLLDGGKSGDPGEVQLEIAVRGLVDLQRAVVAGEIALEASQRDLVLSRLGRVVEQLAERSLAARWIAGVGLAIVGEPAGESLLAGEAASARSERYAAWLEADPEAALDHFAARLHEGGGDAAVESAERFVDALELADWNAFRHAKDLDLRLANRLDIVRVEPRAAMFLAGARPAMRSVELLDRVLEDLGPGLAGGEPLDRDLLAALEVHDLEALRTRLTDWLRREGDAWARHRSAARQSLLRVGAPSLGAEAIELLASEGLEDLDPDRLRWLARSVNGELTARWLRELPDTPFADPEHGAARLATAFGLLGFDDELMAALERDFASPALQDALAGSWSAMVAALRQQAPVEAFAHWLQARPADRSVFDFCGRIDHPAVRAHLTAFRDHRAWGGYADSLVELARLGDAAARAELLAAHRAGVYFWGDDMDRADRSLDGDPEFVAFWRDALQSNCCTCVVAAGALEEIYGIDATSWTEDSMLTRSEGMERHIRRFGNRLRPSRVAGYPVVGPR